MLPYQGWVAGESKVAHAKLLSDLKRRLPEVELHDDYMPNIFRFERNFNIVFPKREEWINGTFPKEGDVNVYIDGSKTDDGTGAGVHCIEMNYNISIPLGNLCTVYQSEILALIEERLRLRLRDFRVTTCTTKRYSSTPPMNHL